MAHSTLTRPLLALALAAAGLASVSSAHALTFVFKDVGSTPMTSVQLNAFQAAGAYWSGQLTDNVTVYMNIAFNSLGSGILGSTGSNFTSVSYSTVRGALLADAKSATDATATASLQSGPALTFMATQGDLSSRLDNDGSLNNTLLGVTTANAKAMGLSIGTSAANPDASITFSTNFNFDFDRSNGITAGSYDFLTVAEHEIGHALGFVSGVDDIDYCAGATGATACNLPNTANRFEGDWWYEPLDLFRYSASGVMDVRVGGSPYFSINGGSTSIAAFSSGTNYGNGYQASHFGTGVVTLMRPFVSAGQSYDASAADLLAMDAIGWDVAAAVPEPATYAFMLGGLAVVGAAARRRRAG